MSPQRINSQTACVTITTALVRSRPAGEVTADYALDAIAKKESASDLATKYGAEYIAGWRDGWTHQSATAANPSDRYREGVEDGKTARVQCRTFWNQL